MSIYLFCRGCSIGEQYNHLHNVFPEWLYHLWANCKYVKVKKSATVAKTSHVGLPGSNGNSEFLHKIFVRLRWSQLVFLPLSLFSSFLSFFFLPPFFLLFTSFLVRTNVRYQISVKHYRIERLHHRVLIEIEAQKAPCVSPSIVNRVYLFIHPAEKGNYCILGCLKWS